MSERRAARAQQHTRPRPAEGSHRAQVDVLRRPVDDPVWRDAATLREVFGELFGTGCESRLAMGGKVNNHLTARWALANGFESEQWAKTPDWRAVRRYLEAFDA